jgi:hypothetical protein
MGDLSWVGLLVRRCGAERRECARKEGDNVGRQGIWWLVVRALARWSVGKTWLWLTYAAVVDGWFCQDSAWLKSCGVDRAVALIWNSEGRKDTVLVLTS